MTYGIYHSADNDGLMCAAILKHFKPEIKLIGYDYGKPLDEINSIPDGSEVYMADVSLPKDQMLSLASRVNLTWIDHHKSAFQDYSDAPNEAFFGQLSGMRVSYYPLSSACELLWDYLSYNPKPELVKWVGDYDLFRDFGTQRWKDVMCREYAVRSVVKNDVQEACDLFESCLGLSASDFEDFYATGRLIYNYLQHENKSYVDRHHIMGSLVFTTPTETLQLNALIINRTELSSDFFKHLEKDIVVMYEITKDGVLFSLRDCDRVGEICKLMGGGGHARAGGFTSKRTSYYKKGIEATKPPYSLEIYWA